MLDNTSTEHGITRRGFLKDKRDGGHHRRTVFCAGFRVRGGSASNRINVACIGVGNQGFPNLQRFLKFDDCQVVAVCDVNRGSNGYKDPSDIRGREPAKQEVEKHYAAKKGVDKYAGCEAYNDFREVLARKDIDAVMVCAARPLARANLDCRCRSGQGHLLRKTVRPDDWRSTESDRCRSEK